MISSSATVPFIQSRWSSTCGFSFLVRGRAWIKHFNGRHNFLSSLYAGIDNHSLTIEHYIAGCNHSTDKVGSSARDIFGEFERAHLKDMLIKVKNHRGRFYRSFFVLKSHGDGSTDYFSS